MNISNRAAAVVLGLCSLITSAALTAGSESSACTSCSQNFLEEVTVTGSRTEKTLMESPLSLSVVTGQEIQQSTTNLVAELLRDVPGVQLTDAGQPGLMRIRIRGEESRRTAILIDGQEVTDHREVGVPLTLDPSMIARVEVLRGAGSVLYGSKAISGVVNFITHKGGTRPLQATVSGNYDSATSGEALFASLYGNVQGLEYRLAASRSDRNDRHTPVGELEDTASESDSVYAYLGKQLGSHRVELSYDNYNSSAEVYVEEEERTTPPLVDFRISVPQRDREKSALSYQGSNLGSLLTRVTANLYRQVSDRQFDTFPSLDLGTFTQDRSIFTSSELTTDGALLQLDWQPHADHYLITGLQYLDDRVEQDRLTETLRSFLPVVEVERFADQASIETIALFAQNEWQMNDSYTLAVGLRQYWVEGQLDESDRDGLLAGSRDDTELIGSLALTYAGLDNTILRATFAQSYVYPSLLQLATGAFAGSNPITPNPDLEPETAISWELGARYQSSNWQVDATVFFNEAEDYIDHVFCNDSDACLPGRSPKTYVNIGESTSYGVETYLAWQLLEGHLTPYTSLTWMRRENDFTNQFSTQDSGIPQWNGTVGVKYDTVAFDAVPLWLDFYLRGESAADKEEPGTRGPVIEHNAGWVTYNLAGGTAFGAAGQFRLALELQNLGDKKYSTATENLLAPERSVAVKLTTTF
ncbi:MAG: TonB-dependent receptor plug domain-containing protein [Pseudomonadales bacterium]